VTSYAIPLYTCIYLPQAFFLDISTHEEDTINLGRNILKKLLKFLFILPKDALFITLKLKFALKFTLKLLLHVLV